jgi:hypothetical protein
MLFGVAWTVRPRVIICLDISVTAASVGCAAAWTVGTHKVKFFNGSATATSVRAFFAWAVGTSGISFQSSTICATTVGTAWIVWARVAANKSERTKPITGLKSNRARSVDGNFLSRHAEDGISIERSADGETFAI